MTKNLLDPSHTVCPARFLLSHSVKRGLKSSKDEGKHRKQRKHRGRRNNMRWREAKMKGGRQKGRKLKSITLKMKEARRGMRGRTFRKITKSLRDHTHR